MRKFFLLFLSLMLTACWLIPGANPVNYSMSHNIEVTGQSAVQSDKNLDAMQAFAAKKTETVYIGGTPLGIILKSKGLIIIGKTNIITEFGLKSTVNNSDIQNGDVLIKIENTDVNTAEDLSKIINEEQLKGKVLKATLIRGGKEIEINIEPQLDITTKKYKAGLWVREETFGIGTLTYIRESDKRFGALGHPVTDPDTGETLSILNGKTTGCNITGVIKGERGKAGELKGVIAKDEVLGSIDKNNVFGIFGMHEKACGNLLYPDPVAVMPHKDIKPGKAKILTTLEGKNPKEYDIEIIKNFNQSKMSDKNLVIRITDKELLSKTGGIVQGMSGSPIIQNGKLCGAVTHVFINDPTKGYGVFADFMLEH